MVTVESTIQSPGVVYVTADEFPFDSALVTGGAGFIGSHLVARLLDDCAVTVYEHFATSTPDEIPDSATVIEADIQNRDRLSAAVEDADIVYHKAAQVSVTHSIENPTESRSVNVDPVLTILEAARDTETRVVLASSTAIYGQPDDTPVDEGHPKEPVSPYGLEKLTVDFYCRLYQDLYDVETVSLRYFNVYGPRQSAGAYSGVISSFHEQARASEPLIVEGDGSQTRDFMHVDDVVQANLHAAPTDATGEAFNIGTGTATTIRELAETIQQITDSRSDIVHVDAREGDIDHSQADITKAREVLGFEPQMRIEDGIGSFLT